LDATLAPAEESAIPLMLVLALVVLLKFYVVLAIDLPRWVLLKRLGL
jgi:hypothetical protein